MKKAIKMFAVVLAITVFASCVGFAVSAAYVTDGENIYSAGDANADGQVDICDLVAAKNGLGTTAASDLDGSGTVESYDYALIRAMILGIDNSQWTE